MTAVPYVIIFLTQEKSEAVRLTNVHTTQPKNVKSLGNGKHSQKRRAKNGKCNFYKKFRPHSKVE